MTTHTHVIDTVDLLKDTSGAKNKMVILVDNQNNPAFVETLRAALDPYIVFYASELPLPTKDLTDYYDEALISTTLLGCDLNASRKMIRETVQYVSNLCGMDERKRKFWSSVVAKDLVCGVGAKSINKAYGRDVINIFSPMKGEEESNLEKMTPPYAVQDKLDGTRCPIFVNPMDDVVEIFSSSGRPYPNLHTVKAVLLDQACHHGINHPFFLDTELVFHDEDDTPLPRAVSNGLSNRSLNGSNSEEAEERAVFYCFDMMNENALGDGDTTPYSTRMDNLTTYLSGFESDCVQYVPFEVCKDLAEVRTLYDKAVEQRKEGIMVKTLSHPYEPKRSAAWTKIKRVYTLSVEVTGVQEHKKKAGRVGSLLVQSSDGLIAGKVGTGLDEADRDMNDFVGRIVEIKIHDLTVKKGKYNFYLPRYIETRHDKDEADSSEKIFEIVKWENQ